MFLLIQPLECDQEMYLELVIEFNLDQNDLDKTFIYSNSVLNDLFIYSP